MPDTPRATRKTVTQQIEEKGIWVKGKVKMEDKCQHHHYIFYNNMLHA